MGVGTAKTLATIGATVLGVETVSSAVPRCFAVLNAEAKFGRSKSTEKLRWTNTVRRLVAHHSIVNEMLLVRCHTFLATAFPRFMIPSPVWNYVCSGNVASRETLLLGL